MSTGNILLTGGTGAIGSALVPCLRRTYPDATIHIVTRHERSSFDAAIRYHQCDLTSPVSTGSGVLERIAAEADLVVHAAADVNWARTVGGALEANTAPTEQLVQLLTTRGRNLRRFVHVSTAFVDAPARDHMGSQEGVLAETNFVNGYEYSKWRAEEVVTTSSLPWQISRPSLVVGSTVDGRIGRYSGIYYLFRMYAGGFIPVVPYRPDSLIDFVPVDHVAECIVDLLSENTQTGRIDPVVSGSSAMRVTDMMSTILEAINGYRLAHGAQAIEEPKLIDLHRYVRFHRPFIERHAKPIVHRTTALLNAFLPYLSVVAPFGDPPNRPAPRPDTYLTKIASAWCDEHPRLAMSQLFDWSVAVDA